MLNFTGANGIFIQNGKYLKRINGFKIVGDETKVGVYTANNSYVSIGGNMIIQDFDTCVLAYRNSTIVFETAGAIISSCVTGVQASYS